MSLDSIVVLTLHGSPLIIHLDWGFHCSLRVDCYSCLMVYVLKNRNCNASGFVFSLQKDKAWIVSVFTSQYSVSYGVSGEYRILNRWCNGLNNKCMNLIEQRSWRSLKITTHNPLQLGWFRWHKKASCVCHILYVCVCACVRVCEWPDPAQLIRNVPFTSLPLIINISSGKQKDYLADSEHN